MSWIRLTPSYEGNRVDQKEGSVEVLRRNLLCISNEEQAMCNQYPKNDDIQQSGLLNTQRILPYPILAE